METTTISTKDKLKNLAIEADKHVSALEIIAEQVQEIRDELKETFDNARKKLDALTAKRDEAQGKYDALSDSAAEGPRGEKLREKIEKYQDAIDAEDESTGLTLEGIVQELETAVDRLECVDEFDPDNARAFADGIDNAATETDEDLFDVEISEE